MEPHSDPSPERSEEEALLTGLTEECLRHLEDGRSDAIEALLKEHPQHAAEVRRRLSRLQAMGLVVVGSAGSPSQPERLGPFRILHRLGAGGMGVVYLAIQEPLEREVALKVIRSEQLHFEDSRERFRREIEAVARLKHPCIVPVYLGGEEQGVPYYAMEYLEGASLEEIIERLRGQFPADLRAIDLLGGDRTEADADSWETACLRVMMQVADALHHAHQRGVLHRDVKPSNVMVLPDGRAMLLDFGLASTSGGARLTATRSPVGSLLYMSPEQVEGPTADLDERTDVYSLGATLYELLTLRPAFLGESYQSTARQILDGHPAAPRSHHPSLSWDSETVCLTAMDRDPARRYRNAADLARDLRNVLERRPIEARRPHPALRVRRWVQRHPTRSVALLLAFVLVVVGPTAFGLQMMFAREDLEVERNKAVAAQRTALDALADADAARMDAERQRDHADRNSRKARAAVDFFLREVGDQSLESIPQMEPVRRRLLEEALRYYQEFLAENVTDPALRGETAEAHTQVSHIHSLLGNKREAILASERCVALLERLVEEEPAELRWRRSLARGYSDLGRLHHTLGQVTVAGPWYDRSIALLESTPELQEDRDLRVNLALFLNNQSVHLCETGRTGDAVVTARRVEELLRDVAAGPAAQITESVEYARALGNVGRALTMQGDLKEGLEASARSLEQWRQVIRVAPGDASVRIELALAMNRVAHNYQRQGDYESCIAPLEESHELLVDLCEDYPDRPDLRWHLGQALMNLGIGWEMLGDVASAEESYGEALDVQEALVDEYPEVPDYASELGGTLSNLADMWIKEGEPEMALDLLEEAIEHQTRALRSNPGHPLYNRFLTTHYSHLQSACLMLEDHAGAFEALENLVRRLGPEPEVRRRGLASHAECIRLARNDDLMDEEERAATVAGYADSMLLEVERLVLRGDLTVSEVETAADLAPLRECAGYETWREERGPEQD